MSTGDALFQAILDNPEEDAPRLVYADWLEEHDQAERAQFIRLQIDLARLPEGAPGRTELEVRQLPVLRSRRPDWVGPLADLVDGWTFRRGFVEEVTLPARDFVKVGGKLKANGSEFTDSVEVFVDGVAFARPASVSSDNGLVVQKGPLVDGRFLTDVLTPGKTVLISFRNSTGGIGAFSYTKQ